MSTQKNRTLRKPIEGHRLGGRNERYGGSCNTTEEKKRLHPKYQRVFDRSCLGVSGKRAVRVVVWVEG